MSTHHSHYPSGDSSNGDDYHPVKRQKVERVRRWNSPTAVKSFIPGVPLLLPNKLTPHELDALLLRARIEELTYQIKNEDTYVHIPRRSPSPPPLYDGNGKRTNTREQRIKGKLERERHLLIEQAKKLNPAFKPPSDYKPVSVKFTQKIKIPIDKFPEYNFIGLILGPRGSTQKDMERKTNTKISIRGKGAVKSESKRRYSNPDDNEDLHVLISGDSEKQVKEAGRMIEDLLVPVEDEKNDHKWKQLELLAVYNGTKTGSWKGKNKREFNSDGAPAIYCTFCDEVSHPTSDCPFKDKPGAVSKFDLEYKSLMESIIDEGDSSNPATNSNQMSATTEKSYSELMAYVNNLGNENIPTNSLPNPSDQQMGLQPPNFYAAPPQQTPMPPSNLGWQPPLPPVDMNPATLPLQQGQQQPEPVWGQYPPPMNGSAPPQQGGYDYSVDGYVYPQYY